MRLVVFFLVAVAVFAPRTVAQGSADDELMFVISMSRHGARAPNAIYPNDRHQADSWPGLGQLTAAGMRQHYLLGAEFRDRYIVQQPFLSATYDHNQVLVRSTDIERTLQSAVSQLAGLYPSGNGPVLADEIAQSAHVCPPILVDKLNVLVSEIGNAALPHAFQPIPVHTVDASSDFFLRSYDTITCPRIQQMEMLKRSNPLWTKKVAETLDFVARMSQLSGLANMTLESTVIIDDCLTSERFEKMPWNDGFTEQDKQTLSDIHNFVKFVYFNDPDFKRIAASEFFKDMVERFSHHVSADGLPSRRPLRMMLHLAHDTTIAAFLSAMDVFDGINPPFASNLRWELYRRKQAPMRTADSYFVRVIYNDQLLQIPSCTAADCPFIQFITFLKSRTVPDIRAACGIIQPVVDASSQATTSQSTVLILTTVLSLLTGAVVALSVSSFMAWRKTVADRRSEYLLM